VGHANRKLYAVRDVEGGDGTPKRKGQLVTHIRSLLACLVLIGLAGSASASSKARGPFPYVQSGPDGVFYARCVPAQGGKGPGSTKIFRVRAEQDELLDSYDWYAQAGVVLGWSPIEGKVAVMRVHREEREAAKPAAGQAEVSFYLGGKLLKSYTSRELVELGAEEPMTRQGYEGANYKVVGCEQVPGTNRYLFVIEGKGKRRISFDIVTGNCEPAPVKCG
jgi:hypothetical protein